MDLRERKRNRQRGRKEIKLAKCKSDLRTESSVLLGIKIYCMGAFLDHFILFLLYLLL